MDKIAIEELALAAIRSGSHSFASIFACLRECEPDFRAVDRALQRLRKRGTIAYERKGGWRIC